MSSVTGNGHGSSRSEFTFYGPVKPSVQIANRTYNRVCGTCGNTYVGKVANERCPKCRPERAKRKQKEAYERLKARMKSGVRIAKFRDNGK